MPKFTKPKPHPDLAAPVPPPSKQPMPSPTYGQTVANRAQVRREVNQELHKIAGGAMQQLEKRIKKGDTRAIIYLLDKVMPKHGELLSVPLASLDGLKTIDDVTSAAERVTTAFLDQTISRSEAEGAMKVLSQYAGLRLAQHVGEMEAKIVDIEARTGLELNKDAVRAATDAIPAQLLPKWGGIADRLLDDE